jgi:hypothetical protein
MIFFTTIFLVSCVYRHGPGPNVDLVREKWTRQVDVNPSAWLRGSDRWFTEGGANRVEEMNQSAPGIAAISTMMVRVPCNFTNIRVQGQFQVQIFGTSGNNSVYVYGPNDSVRGVVVKATEHTLYLYQAKDAPCHMGTVIVRIGIKDLRSLSQMGAGSIEARMIRSNDLCINSSGSGHVYLAGAVNLKNVKSSGSGCVSVFGAVTPELAIKTTGLGSVNVSGNVGIHCITHHGSGDINIIGANSDSLTIHADGCGKIGINGRVAVDEIDARGHVRVYSYYVNGDLLRTYVTDYAQVGLAGCMKTLYVDAGKASRFEGRYLYTQDAYVRAHDAAHINVMASNKVFASATDNSSVYFFGSPNTLSQFFRDNGVVMPILGDKPRSCQNYCPYYNHTPKVVVTGYKD